MVFKIAWQKCNVIYKVKQRNHYWLENQLSLLPLLLALLLSLFLILIWWTIWQDGGNIWVFYDVEIWLLITMVATTSLLTEIRGLTLLFLSAPKDRDAEVNIEQHLESAKTAPPSAVTFMDSDNGPKGHLLILNGHAIDANGRTATCAVLALMSAYYVFALEYQYGVYMSYSGVCVVQHIGHYVSKHRMKCDVQYENEKSKYGPVEDQWIPRWKPLENGVIFTRTIFRWLISCRGHHVSFCALHT